MRQLQKLTDLAHLLNNWIVAALFFTNTPPFLDGLQPVDVVRPHRWEFTRVDLPGHHARPGDFGIWVRRGVVYFWFRIISRFLSCQSLALGELLLPFGRALGHLSALRLRSRRRGSVAVSGTVVVRLCSRTELWRALSCARGRGDARRAALGCHRFSAVAGALASDGWRALRQRCSDATDKRGNRCYWHAAAASRVQQALLERPCRVLSQASSPLLSCLPTGHTQASGRGNRFSDLVQLDGCASKFTQIQCDFWSHFDAFVAAAQGSRESWSITLQRCAAAVARLKTPCRLRTKVCCW